MDIAPSATGAHQDTTSNMKQQFPASSLSPLGPEPLAHRDRRDFIRRTVALSVAALWQTETTLAQEKTMNDTRKHKAPRAMLAYDDIRAVSPALERYTKGTLLDSLWKRPGISPRDRSIVTVAALIARNQTSEMPFHFALSLDNGVKPGELSEIITHLAFYAGWANAMSAVAVAKEIFHQRAIGLEQLPPAIEKLLPIDEAAEKQRSTQVINDFGAVSPGLVENTTDLLFRELWLRPALAPRDRSLVTVSALVANGQAAQVTFHLNRAMDHGLTQEQTSEILTHIAFYSGWPCAFSALPGVKGVFEKRATR
jgi:4-carboxymuconolactone decarboxylase